MVATNGKSWLVAAWPGMGNVGVIAGHVLVHQLGMEPVAALSGEGVFDLEHVEVKDGVVGKPRLPRGVLYQWKDAPVGKGLLVFLAEAQPSAHGLDYARALLKEVSKYNVERVFTFAAMASQMHPSADARVFTAATDTAMLDDLKAIDIHVLPEGQISGMNGLLLGAAVERSLPGACLLGEIPFYGAGVPNPKTARALLDTFGALRDLHIDTSELAEQAEKVERVLLNMFEQLGDDAAGHGDDGEEDDDDEAGPELPKSAGPAGLDNETQRRIDELFAQAQRDRSTVVKLKSELDRLGVFRQYENRFLDLFRRAE
ncbi:MAG: proteasome assembly chaperone family protein [Phycisphaerales bacterium]|nr:proteasome assembly chaperone family protein [Phycisphaerales bacterium]